MGSGTRSGGGFVLTSHPDRLDYPLVTLGNIAFLLYRNVDALTGRTLRHPLHHLPQLLLLRTEYPLALIALPYNLRLYGVACSNLILASPIPLAHN